MNGCKDCPAFAKCTETYRGSGCAALRWTYGIDGDPEIITNADRIRAMSDEELAEWVNDSYTICGCCSDDNECREPFNREKCLKGVLMWLQQPAEEVDHDTE